MERRTQDIENPRLLFAEGKLVTVEILPFGKNICHLLLQKQNSPGASPSFLKTMSS
jgi:hypothetical protein